MLGLIWIQTVRHLMVFLVEFFEKVNFEKKSTRRQKSIHSLPCRSPLNMLHQLQNRWLHPHAPWTDWCRWTHHNTKWWMWNLYTQSPYRKRPPSQRILPKQMTKQPVDKKKCITNQDSLFWSHRCQHLKCQTPAPEPMSDNPPPEEKKS